MNSKELLKFFCYEFRQKYHHPYPIRWAIDTKIISGLLKEGYGWEMVKRFLWIHIHECSEFVRSKGHNLCLLKSQIPQYIIQYDGWVGAVESKIDSNRINNLRDNNQQEIFID